MLPSSPARRAERVDLVDEDGAWGVRARHVEEAPHHALALAPPLGSQRRRRDVEERRPALGGHRLGQHGFARPGGAEHEDALPGPSDALTERIGTVGIRAEASGWRRVVFLGGMFPKLVPRDSRFCSCEGKTCNPAQKSKGNRRTLNWHRTQ